jgi:hypothetical protein
MPARRLTRVLAMVALAAIACGPPPPPPPPPAPQGPPQLQPAEEFDWTGQKISFSLPPAGWRREGETSGGIKGVRFVKERSVGEAIGIGDYYILADRNRGPYLREMLAKFDSYDLGFAWSQALRKTYAYTDTPFTALESEIAQIINRSVSQADAAFRTRDRAAARAHLETALAAAERLHFSLAEVVDRVEFKPERRQEPDKYKVTGRREALIAGLPAVVVDYTVFAPERARTYTAREAYVVHNSHLFICTFIGLPETLEVFDLMVASIKFPE